MKKNRNFIMFVIMLMMMTMMATLATRQFPQTALVELHFEYVENVPIPNRFEVRNITDERLWFTKRYEVYKPIDEDVSVLIYETMLDEVFFIEPGGFYTFSYDFSENAPEFIEAELAPGVYRLAKIYIFHGSEQEHVISIQGHVFIIWPCHHWKQDTKQNTIGHCHNTCTKHNRHTCIF